MLLIGTEIKWSREKKFLRFLESTCAPGQIYMNTHVSVNRFLQSTDREDYDQVRPDGANLIRSLPSSFLQTVAHLFTRQKATDLYESNRKKFFSDILPLDVHRSGMNENGNVSTLQFIHRCNISHESVLNGLRKEVY